MGALANDWEKDDVLRCRGRSSGCLTKWLTPQVKGIPSMKNIDLNSDALLHIANRWAPLMKEARCPPVPLLRAEVFGLMNRTCRSLLKKNSKIPLFPSGSRMEAAHATGAG